MRYRIMAVLIGTVMLLSQGAVADDVLEKVISKTFDAEGVEMLRIDNLVGRVLIEGTTDDRIKIETVVNAAKSMDMSAEQVADLIDLRIDQNGDRLLVVPGYPLDEYRNYRYRPGKGGFFGNRSEFRIDGRKVRVYSGRKGKGLELWVDIRISLPEGVRCDLRNRMGGIKLDKVHSECRVDCASADVRVDNQVGDLLVDSGSGDIVVSGCEGYLDLDTGSGDVRVSGLRGDLRADTGSGDVMVRDANGEELYADTGSGEVELAGVDYPRLRVDTGSGDVMVESTRGDVDHWMLDTGSGDVVLTIHEDASFRMEVDTGSGDVNCDFRGADIRSQRGEIRSITVGDGRGDVEVDTGSGDVTLRRG